MSNVRLCPYCLRWHHPADDCEPEAMLAPWTGIDPARQDRADHVEAELIRTHRSARRRRSARRPT